MPTRKISRMLGPFAHLIDMFFYGTEVFLFLIPRYTIEISGKRQCIKWPEIRFTRIRCVRPEKSLGLLACFYSCGRITCEDIKGESCDLIKAFEGWFI